jgi:hypothetical protein
VITGFLTTGDATALLQFADAITGRLPDGNYGKNANEIFQFVNCLDWDDRPTPDDVAALVEHVRPFSPRLGAFTMTFALMNSTSCPFPPTPVPPVSNPDVPPLLVVGNHTDAETPLHWSQELSEELPGSRLLVSMTTCPASVSRSRLPSGAVLLESLWVW